MACRRAYEIDLEEYLAAPTGERWNDFRRHFPTCKECATEVREHSRLEELLLGPELDEHPEPELLLRFEEQSGSLTKAERTSVETHLAQCHSCADEITALRRMNPSVNPSAADEHAAAEAKREDSVSWRETVRRVLSPIKGLALHPAFAYALLLLALTPNLIRWTGTSASTPAGVATPDPRAKTLRTRPRGIPSPEWSIVLLKPDQQVEVKGPPQNQAGITLRVPLPADLPKSPTAEITVAQEGGRRELRELFPDIATGTDHIDLQLPNMWLQPGSYDVTLRVARVARTRFKFRLQGSSP